MTYVKKTHRFGLLTPSSNTTQEPEFSAALPPAVSLHTGRVSYRDITPEEQDRCVLELESESRKLADAEVDVIVFAATAPTLAKGKGYDRELIKRMEDASGRPATTAATAFLEALRLLYQRKDNQQALSEHERIVEVLAKRETARAESLMREHILTNRDVLVRALQAGTAAASGAMAESPAAEADDWPFARER